MFFYPQLVPDCLFLIILSFVWVLIMFYLDYDIKSPPVSLPADLAWLPELSLLTFDHITNHKSKSLALCSKYMCVGMYIIFYYLYLYIICYLYCKHLYIIYYYMFLSILSVIFILFICVYIYIYLMVFYLMCHRYMSESKVVHLMKCKTILNIWISHLC